MKNSIFNIVIKAIVILILIFISTPLILLILRGVSSISSCLESDEVMFSVGLSLKTSIISTIICMIISIPAGYGLSRLNIPFKKTIGTIIYLPMSFPHIISGIALLLVCGNSFIGKYLQSIGLDFVFTIKGIILAQVFVNISFAIKMIKTAIDSSSSNLEFVGRTLGCNEFMAFRKITLKSIQRDIVSTTIITFSRSLGEFGAIMILVGTTRMKTEIMPTSIYLNVSTGDMDVAIGIATILIVISTVSILIFDYIEEKRRY